MRTAVLALCAALSALAVLASCAVGSVNAQQGGEMLTCNVLWVHDGDTFRCDGFKRSTRLYGIDAPEMPGACREGRQCVEGDPIASRDQLAALINGQPLRCILIEYDRYQRPVMRCEADGADLSCAMVKSGHDIERYGRLDC